MKLLQEFLEEETMHFDPVPEHKISKTIVRRYQVMLSLKIGGNELFFRTRVNASHQKDALEQSHKLMHENIRRMRSIGFEVVNQQAVLLSKEEIKK